MHLGVDKRARAETATRRSEVPPVISLAEDSPPGARARLSPVESRLGSDRSHLVQTVTAGTTRRGFPPRPVARCSDPYSFGARPAMGRPIGQWAAIAVWAAPSSKGTNDRPIQQWAQPMHPM
ncbi:hypothetical protein EV426DRAFT_579103 [Tirmania nivea]|nr:hypothetical protein EV426DRAFT_579103 [Tirmania nivea]